MNFRLRAWHFVALLCILAAALAAATLPGYAQPRITVTVSGDHNPVKDFVYLNDQRLYPNGQGGKTYMARGKSGESKITLSGAFIKTSEAIISAGNFSEQQIEMPVVNRGTEEIIRETLDESTAEIQLLREFRRSETLVFTLKNPKHPEKTAGHEHTVLLHYDANARSWLNLSLSLLNDPDVFSIGDEAVDYFFEIAGT